LSRWGYLSDPKLRRALEQHAVDDATNYYEGLGYLVEDVGATRSYDPTSPGNTRSAESRSRGPQEMQSQSS
jgi:hypothetical protein